MNKVTFLFLFFIFSLPGESKLLFPLQTDSLLYYHNIITKPKSDVGIEKAFLFFDKRIKNSLLEGDTLSAIQDLRRVAIGQFELGFLFESEGTAVKAFQLVENIPQKEMTHQARMGIYNHLGLVYRNLQLYSKSLAYYRQSLELVQSQDDSLAILNNIANIYLDQGNYNLAETGYTEILSKSSDLNNDQVLARAIDNLGFVQSKLKKDEALNNLLMALDTRKSIQDIPGLYSSYYHLSIYYKDRDQFKIAKEYADLAYAIAKQLKSASYLRNVLSLLLDFITDPQVSEYKKLIDSLNLANQIQSNKYAFVKYNVEREQERTKAMEIQKVHQENLKLFYLTIGIVILIMGSIIFILMRSRYKKEKRLEVYITENKFSKKIHDEFANDIAGISNYIQNKTRIEEGEKNKILTLLDELYLRARDISVKTGAIDLKNYSRALRNLIMQHNTASIKIIINSLNSIPWQNIPDYKKIAIYRAIQEMLINTSKYAKASEITIGFLQSERSIKVTYYDNGIGFEKSEKNLQGLKNVETRMASIQGNFSFESSLNNGFKGTLVFRF